MQGGEPLLEVNQELARYPQEFFSVYGLLENDLSMSGHNEMLHGGASPRGRTTAEEIITRRSMLGAQQQFIVLMLENALSQLFTKTRNHILQYKPVEDWLDLGNAFGDPDADPDKREVIEQTKREFLDMFQRRKEIRYAMVNEPNMPVTGVTAAYKRTRESEALGSLFKMLFENPVAGLLMGLDPSQVATELLWRIDGIDPDKLMLQPVNERQEIIQQAMAQVFAVSVGAQPGGGEEKPASPGGGTVGTMSPGVQGRK